MKQVWLLVLALIVGSIVWDRIQGSDSSGAPILQERIRATPNLPSMGNLFGHDVVVAEFFDYHCGYCKGFRSTLEKLHADDPGVHIVYIDFPTFGGDSILAAKAALAVDSIDEQKYVPFHAALMDYSGRFDEGVLAQKAEEVGISPEVFEKALADPARDKELQRNYQLAGIVHAHGVPTVVVGNAIIRGAVELDTLKSVVAQEREHAAAAAAKSQK